MRRIMREANGVGLAAPQIGVPLRVFVAEVNKKFYAFVNPEIVKTSSEEEYFEEGCLSLPGVYGEVRRPSKIVMTALNERGERVKVKAWGLLARVFQHEIDHLNGMLFVDKAERTHRIEDGS
jgi:peptide deformylase